MIESLGQFPPPAVLVAALAAVVTASVAAVALRNRSVPGAGWLAVVMAIDAIVAAFAAWGHALPRTRQVALAVGGLGLLAAVPFVAFVVAYTGRGRHLTYGSLLGYGGALFVGAALYATTQYHGLVLAHPVEVHRSAGLTLLSYGGFGPLVAPMLLYVGVLLFGSLLLLLQTVVRHDRLYLGQSTALFVGSVAPLAAVLPSFGGGVGIAAATGVRAAVVASGLMTLSGVALAYAAARHRLFEFVPAVRQLGDQAAVDDLDEGILIVGEGGNVVKLNAAAAAVLGCEGRDVVGSPATGLFERVGVDDVTATPTTFERGNRTYEVTRSPITDERDRPIGRTYVLRDVTRRERRKQRLQVLNRVLRHNVRNDMSVVQMNAGIVAEEGNDRLAELGENMVAVADGLVDIGEKVRRIEQLLSAEELARQAVDVETLLESAVDDALVGFDPVDVTVDVDDDVDTISVNRSLLALALENVLENAVEHNDAAVPRVAVTADRVDDGVRLTVADDGPGIPDQELAALDAGRESALQHASSLGLWLVLWGVQRLGGDLQITHLSPTGTAVSVWLPDADQEEGDALAAVETSPRDVPAEDSPAGRVDGNAVALVADGVADDGATGGSPPEADDDGTSSVGGSGPGSSTDRTAEVPPPPPPTSATPSGDGSDASDGERAVGDGRRDDGADPTTDDADPAVDDADPSAGEATGTPPAAPSSASATAGEDDESDGDADGTTGDADGTTGDAAGTDGRRDG